MTEWRVMYKKETPMKRADLTEKILDVKREKGWSWKHICSQIGGYSEVLLVGALLAIWVAAARGPATGERLVRYSAASLVAFIALSKVLSPQFLIWLIPLVPLVRGRRGLAASALFGLALLLTQLWFPIRYWDLALRFAAFPSWLVVARDLVLLALLAVLLIPFREREPAPAGS